ncbi:MAG: FkbM family methyltransferase [Chloroflexi bacterium]|nr:FkbM family methyltransferase [Chloroflexota bacterium]MBM3152744.1 FkbM family methyltransferase [Chloroflexota bacterium]
MKLINLAKTLFSGNTKGHFGQWAEDVLVRKLFPKNMKTGIYLDIGAYHPFKHSNTAYLWLKGWQGFNIDANPNTIKLFNRARPDDKNIWTAIVPHDQFIQGVDRVDLMLPGAKDHASGISATGTVHPGVSSDRSFSESISVPAISVSKLLEQHNINNINYLNVDIEGYDQAIIEEFDFARCHPKVISIEDYSNTIQEALASPITTHLAAQGYVLIGRAGPTSIFLFAE